MSCKRSIAPLVAATLVLLYNGPARAAPDGTPARAAIVMEQGSRRVLFEKNAHERLAMASTTKIMTALVALERGNPGDTVTVSPAAAKMPGSSIYLKAGEKLTLGQLLYGLMLQSGNDSAMAVAEHVGGSVEGFLELMNQKAQELGATDTHFASVCGLDAPGHYTTAFDLALIASAAMEREDFRRIVSAKSMRIPYDGLENGRYLRNKNKTLWLFEGANGIKTGYTGDAGRCFVGAAERGGMQLVSVILNCGPMFEESSRLLEQAFADYGIVELATPDLPVGTVDVERGVAGTVRYGAERSLRLPLTMDERERVYAQYQLSGGTVYAPVERGQYVGSGRVMLGDDVLAEFPVVALEADGVRDFRWCFYKVIEGFVWRMDRGVPGFRNIWPIAESPPAGSARN